jgi:geranylgeranyl diphosphate synthase, type I
MQAATVWAPAVPDILLRAKEMTNAPMREAVSTLPAQIRTIVEYHLGWVDASGRPESRGGKAVRPALAILSAEACSVPATTAIPGALAVELVHNFSLLHDDVMDEDRERRHRPTVWTLWGVGQAIIIGDALMTLALEILLERDEPETVAAARRLTADTAAMIRGQVQDTALEASSETTLADCKEMEANKTGALLACASSIGAILAGAPANVIEGLSKYGLHLGLAFQAIDDLLGIWGRPEITGKPAWSDVRQRKKSLPIVAALSNGKPQSEELRDLLSLEQFTESDVGSAVRLIEECGGRQRAEEEAEREMAAALAALEGVPIEPGARAEFVRLARFLGERDH